MGLKMDCTKRSTKIKKKNNQSVKIYEDALQTFYFQTKVKSHHSEGEPNPSDSISNGN